MFRVIPDFPMYMADEEGNILSLYTHRLRKPWVGRDGYPRITLYKDDKTYTVEVHRLVMMAFSDKPDGRVEIHHKDHDKLNNQLDNLM